MKKDLKVAVVQTELARNKDEGEKQVLRFVKKAILQEVDMVGLPEDCISSYKEAKDGYNALEFLSKVAKENSIYLFGANPVLGEDKKLYNVGFLFDRNGELILRHNKVVLTPTEDEITPGNSLEAVNTEFGKIALLVCKDSFHRYAAWFFEEFKKAGVDIVLIPSYSLNVSKRSVGLWVDSLKALSKWFDMYIAAPGTIGKNATPYPSFGHALIICPNREVLAEGSENKEEVLVAMLDKENIEEIRNSYGSKWQPPTIPQVELKVN